MTSIDRLKSLTRAAAAIFIAALIALAAAGCGGGGGGDGEAVGKPQFTPGSGAYGQPVMVAVYSSTAGTTIRYTTDGSAPTASHGEIAVNGVIDVQESATIRAVAVSAGGSVSAVATAAYTITPQAAQPAFSVAGGLYTAAQSVTITTATAGASIRYTTDGSMPSAVNGTLYAGPVSVSSSVTLMAVAYGGSIRTSDVRSATYTITGTVATPDFSPAPGTYGDTLAVSITTATPNATIRYTTDSTEPTRTYGNIYGGAFQVSSTKTVKAIAYRTNWADSAVATGLFEIRRQVQTPVINPATGTYGGVQTVTITTPTASAAIHYTIDGTEPTAGSPTYSGAFDVNATTTVKALAVRDGWDDSAVATSVLTITDQAESPVFSPAAGDYSGPVTVSLTCGTPSSEIRYTLTGTDPTAASGTVYTAPFELTTTKTAKAVCYAEGLATSQVVTAVYNISYTAGKPTFNPAAGTYANSVDVTITAQPVDASIRYTTNGAEPSETVGTLYSAPVHITADTTLKAIAYKGGYTTSEVASGDYVINQMVVAPVISPASGAYRGSVEISMTCDTEGATVRYTTDGSAPTASSTIYGGPFAISSSNTINAKGFKTGYADSDTASAAYTINPVVAAPILSPAPGRYEAAQNLSLTSATPGARIYFTTDGTNPVEDPAYLYRGSLNVSASSVVKAFAVKTGLLDSDMSVGMYTIGTVQEAIFPDLALSLCVREALGIGQADPITMHMLENALFTELDCSDRGIASLNGIQNLVNLEGLNVSRNAITDLTLLAGMTKLKRLDFSYNQIATVEPLRDLVAMEELDLSANVVEDVSPLAAMEAMTKLSAHNNAIGDVSPLSGMGQLQELNLSDNLTIVSIDPIDGLTALKSLNLKGNSISDLTALAGLTGLTYLNVGTNNVSDLTPLSGLIELTDLYLFSNALNEGEESPALAPLTGLHALKLLSVADNQLENLYPLAGLTELRDLDASTNKIDDVRALSGLMKLETLSLDHNDITDVAPLVNLINLKILLAQENCITNFTPLTSALPSLIIVSDPQKAGCADVPRVAENPVLTPGAGDYIGYVDVAIWSPTSGATIHYTTDGTDPSAAVGQVYTGAIRLTTTTTVKAIAFRPDWLNSESAVVTEIYTIVPIAERPTMDPVSGTFPGSVQVAISTTTAGATIRYTTDGTAPTDSNGLVYSTPLTIDATTTLMAVAFHPDYAPSPVSMEFYTIIPVAGAPQFTPGAGTYNGTVIVSATSGTDGASIRYIIDYTPLVLDSDEIPTETAGTLYTGPITITGTSAYLRAVAFKDGYVTSALTEVYYAIMPITATPSIQPNGGSDFAGQVLVSILDATVGASIFYTTDGSTPSAANGVLYSSPFTLSASTTLKAIAYSPDLPPSEVATAQFVITPKMSDPEISPTPGIYPDKVDVVITSESVSAIIRYTTDGSTPSSTNGTIYTGSFQLTSSAVVKAIAYSPGSVDSDVVTAEYTIEPVALAPYFTPGPGTYQGSVDVIIRSNTLNASIRYTTDGVTEPTSTTGTLYTGRFTLSQSATIKAVAYKAGYAASPISSSTYTVIPFAAQPYFVPAPGSYDLSVDVVAIGPTDGSTVRYTLDGTIPTETTGTLFVGPFTLNSSTTVTAVAFKNGMAPSRPATGAFIINSDPVGVFPDPNLDTCVRAVLGVGPLDTLTRAMLEAPTVLDCSSMGIESINGIQNMRSLEVLNLSDNLITDGSLVQGISTLTDLDMSNNRLTTMAPAGYLPFLEFLKLNDNLISDMTPVAKMELITQIHLAGNMIQDLAPVESQITITDLDLSGNIMIDDISPISTLDGITRIGLSYNRIIDLTPLQNLEFVEYLDLGWNELTDISPIAGLTTITELKLNNNHLTDLSAVGQLVNTQALNLRGNLLIDISPLAGLGDILHIELDDNQIVDVSPLASMQNARTMSLTNNNISSVAPLTTLVNLDTLNLAGNCISDLTPVAFVPTVNATPMRASCE